MIINLPLKSFSFFKVITGVIFFTVALVMPVVATYAYITGIFVSRAHGLGAWFAMWRSGRLTWVYVFGALVITILVGGVGMSFLSTFVLAFIANILFAVHFLYDEFDLQEEIRSFHNILSMAAPTILTLLFLVKEYFHLENFSFPLFLILGGMFILTEFIFLTEINWFFVHTKLLTFFVIISMYLGFSAASIIYVFLIYHYSFWFIYPVYKLHKYKRNERDSFIMVLALLLLSSFYYGLNVSSGIPDPKMYEMAFRMFMSVTIIHILVTAPFGYLIGLKKPIKYKG